MVDGAFTARRASSAADRIVFLGHSSVLLELGGVRVMTDPLLRGHVGHLRRVAPPVEEGMMAGVDAVLISHLHHDHLDLASLRQLGQETPMVVPAGAGPWLHGRGFARVSELTAGEATQVGVRTAQATEAGALTVTAVQARHDARRLGPRGPRAAPLGYLVSDRRLVVYFAGDTEFFAEMADFAPAPDVALLPVAGWGPTLGPGHMDPLDAARAVAAIRPRLAIPVHWGTLAPIGLGIGLGLGLGLTRGRRERLQEPAQAFAQHVARLAPATEVRILRPGQATEP